MTLTAAPVLDTARGSLTALGRRSTPSTLRLAGLGLALLALLTGVIAALAIADRQSATSSAWRSAEPLMVTAQAIDTSLSDADTTAAASFLQGRIEPTTLRTRYANDIALSSTDLAAAAQQAGSDPAVAASIKKLSVNLPVYAGIVETANFNERQALYPLAAAYLAEANNLMRTALLPSAAQVYAAEGRTLAADQGNAVAIWAVAIAALLFVGLVVGLVVLQRWMSRRFHRTWNVALVAATVVVALLGIWFAVALSVQDAGVNDALVNGSRPVSTFTGARILALEARADDELTLLTRASYSNSPYQKDYATAAARLRTLLHAPGTAAGASERAQLARAAAAFAAYGRLHDHIRQLDAGGDLGGAVAVASGSSAADLPATSATFDSLLVQGIAGSQQTFTSTTSDAAGDLRGLVIALAVGAIAVALLVLVGLQPRVAEYR